MNYWMTLSIFFIKPVCVCVSEWIRIWLFWFSCFKSVKRMCETEKGIRSKIIWPFDWKTLDLKSGSCHNVHMCIISFFFDFTYEYNNLNTWNLLQFRIFGTQQSSGVLIVCNGFSEASVYVFIFHWNVS